MRKFFLATSIAVLALSSCKEDTTEYYVEPDNIATQNSYDDQAIEKFLSNHYLDDLGNLTSFSDTDSTDDNYTSLKNMNPIRLSSGVIVIKRDNAQPNPGTDIGSTDIIHFMTKAKGYLAYEMDGNVNFYSTPYTLDDTLDGSGVPVIDPTYYYTPQSILDANPGKTRSYWEIEGLREGLQYFKAYNQSDSEPYNLQGVIIVPSRAAFARDDHYNYGGNNWRNRTIVFNFQVYKSVPRP